MLEAVLKRRGMEDLVLISPVDNIVQMIPMLIT